MSISVKELKSIDLSSFTIISTGINVLFSIIVALLFAAGMAITYPNSIGFTIYIAPTIIVGTFIIGIYVSFSEGLFFNLLAKYLNNIKLGFKDEKEITKISNSETAIIIAIIMAIEAVIMYLALSFILPLVLNATIQTLMLTGQESVAYSFYQLLTLFNQPLTMTVAILASLIICFIYILLGTYIYNLFASTGRGIIVSLSKEDKWTVIDSVDIMNFTVAITVISAVLSIISAIILMIMGMNIQGAVINIFQGIISGFIGSALTAVFYNFLAPKIGKLKLELIDQ